MQRHGEGAVVSYLDHPLDLKLALSDLQLEALFRLARGAPPQAIDGRTLRGLEAQRLVDRGSLTSTGRLVAAAYGAGFRRAKAALREQVEQNINLAMSLKADLDRTTAQLAAVHEVAQGLLQVPNLEDRLGAALGNALNAFDEAMRPVREVTQGEEARCA